MSRYWCKGGFEPRLTGYGENHACETFGKFAGNIASTNPFHLFAYSIGSQNQERLQNMTYLFNRSCRVTLLKPFIPHTLTRAKYVCNLQDVPLKF